MKSIKETKPASLPVGDLLTRAEAANILRVHTETVKRWQQAGRLRAFVLGKTVVRYAASDVTALLNGSAISAAAA